MIALLQASVLAVSSFGAVEPVFANNAGEKVKVEFRRAETKNAEGLVEAKVEGTRTKVYLHKEADATNKDIASARVFEGDNKKVLIEVTFTKDGAKKIATLSGEHKGKPVAVVIDGKVVCAPVLRAPLTDKAQISGSFTKDEAEKIVKGLTAP